MASFCGANSTFGVADGELSRCFDEVVMFSGIPFVLIVLLGSLSLRSLIKKWRSHSEYRPLLDKNEEQENYVMLKSTGLYYMKTTMALCLALSSLAMTIYHIVESEEPFRTVTTLVNFLAYAFVYTLLIVEHRIGLPRTRCNKAIPVFFLVQTGLSVPLIMNLLKADSHDANDYVILSQLIVSALSFIASLYSAVVPVYTYNLHKMACPEQTSSYLSQAWFGWFDSLVKKAYKQPLEHEDLWLLAENDSSGHVCARFEDIQDRRRAKGKDSLVGDLAALVGGTFAMQGLYIGIASAFAFSGPYLLKLLLEFMQDYEAGNHSASRTLPYLYVAGLFVGPMINGLADGRNYFLGRRVGLRVRAALIGSIYKKALRINMNEQGDTTVGEITNLMSVDCQKVLDLSCYLHYLWTTPMMIGICLYFLYAVLGWSAFAGVLFMVCTIPLQGFIAWENDFLNKIKQARKTELGHLKRYIYLSAVVEVIFFATPALVSLITFVTYTAIAKNELTVSRAFTALALFNVLRFPLAVLPDMVNELILARVSLKRIESFLKREEMPPAPRCYDSQRGTVAADDAAFSYAASQSAEASKPADVLEQLTLNIKPGSLTTIIGATGSGKSSLLLGLLGEVRRTQGSVFLSGNVAYVPQQAWIMNATVRENILFGKPYDAERYQRTIYACALAKDLEMLDGGDLAEIGEKGVNLSGGQKQRVSLARAVYSDADVYILDDCLSAVDAHVGKHIFHNCIENMLRKKTRLLVSHHVGMCLPRSDHIVVVANNRIVEQGDYHTLKETGVEVKKIVAREGMDLSHENVSEASMPSVAHLSERHVHEQIANTLKNAHTKNTLVEKEKKAEGHISLDVYLSYIHSAGGWGITSVFLLIFVLSQGSVAFQDNWLRVWIQAYDPVSGDRDNVDTYLYIYITIALVGFLTVLCKGLVQGTGSLRASRATHDALVARIIRAPVAFFDRTPLGRIVNRFSSDLASIDQSVAMMIAGFLNSVMSLLSVIIIVSIVTPVFLAGVVPIIVANYFVAQYYLLSCCVR
eukprot:Colp12_sorted_trinity150504_noHs@29356